MLGPSTNEEDVVNLFRLYGTLTEVVLLRTKDENALSKGCAFVKFANREGAERAIASLNQKYRDKVHQKKTDIFSFVL